MSAYFYVVKRRVISNERCVSPPVTHLFYFLFLFSVSFRCRTTIWPCACVRASLPLPPPLPLPLLPFFATTTYQSSPKGPAGTKRPETAKTNRNTQPKTATPCHVPRRAGRPRANYGRRLTSDASGHARITSKSGRRKAADASGSK